MLDQVIFSVIIKATYELLKSKLQMVFGSAKSFNEVFDDTIWDIASKYDVVDTDLKAFLNSGEFLEQLEIHQEDMNIDYKNLAKMLLDYITLLPDFSPERLLKDFFDALEGNLLMYPELREQLIVKYFKVLRQDHCGIIEHTNTIMENQELIKNILSQISVSGKTLRREDYINNIEFFFRGQQDIK